NKTLRLKANERRRTFAEMAVFTDLSDAVRALITAWLEVRVLPGPPPNKDDGLAAVLATLAAAIGDSRKATRQTL
ncbi:MAG TPA: hypothetical protein VGG11_14635, partial [Xanthobacteraceae bacterium]